MAKSKWPCKHGLWEGRRISPSQVDPKQLRAGIEVEREHTGPGKRAAKLACRIALDHLAEDRRYYTKLKKAKL